MKLLLIEDDRVIGQQIAEDFSHWQLETHLVEDFQHVYEQYERLQPDLVLIDIQLPAFDGFHWCRQIRANSNVPILFLSSRDQPMDMVMAMQMGADDYVQKPFHMDVLRSKVQALLRRAYDYQEVSTPSTQRINGLQVDAASMTVSKGEEVVSLTKNEAFILNVLLDVPNEVVTRDTLMTKLWDDARFVNDNTLTVNVNRLRTKLTDLGAPQMIETKKGVGYKLVKTDD